MDCGEELEVDAEKLDGDDGDSEVLFSRVIVVASWDTAVEVTLRAILENQNRSSNRGL
jgi:hypothetical protein